MFDYLILRRRTHDPLHPTSSFLTFLLIATSFVSSPTYAATHWVGNSPECTGSNVHGSLNAAILAAALTTADDEIRLTNTISYTGNIADLTDWFPGVTGRLTLSGGYANCFSSQSGRTTFGSNSGTLFVVKTSSQPSSVVTLRSLELTASGGRALSATSWRSSGAAKCLDSR